MTLPAFRQFFRRLRGKIRAEPATVVAMRRSLATGVGNLPNNIPAYRLRAPRHHARLNPADGTTGDAGARPRRFDGVEVPPPHSVVNPLEGAAAPGVSASQGRFPQLPRRRSLRTSTCWTRRGIERRHPRAPFLPRQAQPGSRRCATDQRDGPRPATPMAEPASRPPSPCERPPARAGNRRRRT